MSKKYQLYWLQEFAFIHDIWVEPEYRQNGIARQMVMLTIERFHHMGVKQIRLDTAVAKEPSRRLLHLVVFDSALLKCSESYELGVMSYELKI
ncbi:GNAT family N-acetyltransferase [Nostoc commune]|uniref:GNAT family N-acetyltransferase n=1 Tax=Nostoc commune TaxID=1178 RepID=UPI001E383C27|nr:GNAT family N-acetyltransferase [Nostoc commune]